MKKLILPFLLLLSFIAFGQTSGIKQKNGYPDNSDINEGCYRVKNTINGKWYTIKDDGATWVSEDSVLANTVTKQTLIDSIASRPRLKSDGRFDYAQPKGTSIWKIPTLDEDDLSSAYLNHNDSVVASGYARNWQIDGLKSDTSKFANKSNPYFSVPQLGLSTDSIMVLRGNVVRKIPKDSITGGQIFLSEYGENNSIANGATFSALADITGSTFTLPSAGTWEVTYNIIGRAATVVVNSVGIYNSSNVIVPNSGSESVTYTAGFANGYTITNTVRITTTGLETFKLRGTSGGTFTVQNTPTSSSKIVWKKLSGYLPMSGSASNSLTIYNGNYVAATVGNIGNTGGATFTVPATGQYEFTFQGTSYSTTANLIRTGTYQIRQGTTVISTATVSFYFNLASTHTTIPTNIQFANLQSGVTYNVIWNTGTFTTDAADYFLVTAKQVGLVGIAGAQINTMIAPTNGQNLTFNSTTGQYEPANDVQNITTNYNYNSVYDTVNNYTFVDYTNLQFSNGTGQSFLKDGQLYAWGGVWKTQNGQANMVNNVPFSPYKADGTEVGYRPFFKKLQYTSENAYVIDQYNKVWACGTDTWGQLGDGATTGRANNVLYLVEYFTTNNIDVVDIQCNGFAGRGGYFYALSTTGNVYPCGYGLYGTMGNNATADVTTPFLLSTLAAPVAKIRTGGKGFNIDGYQTFFTFTNSTTPQAVGYNGTNQLGDGTATQRNVPTTIPTLAGATDIFCGGSFTGAIYGNTAANVKFTGLNTNGNHGKGNTTTSTTFTSSTFAGVASKLYLFQSNAATGVASAILDTARQLWVAGQNYQGWMGENVATAQSNFLSYFKPTTLPQGKIAEFNWVGSAGATSIIRDTSGYVYCAGFNTDGANGQGNVTTTFSYINKFKKVPLPTPSVKILVGGTPESSGAGFCSVDKQGRFYQWGWSGNMASTSNAAVNNTIPHYVVMDGVAKPDTVAYTVLPSNWTSDASVIYPTNLTNKVGIGTSTPTQKLDIVGTGLNYTRIASTTTGALNEAGFMLSRGDQGFGYSQVQYMTGATSNWATGLRPNNLDFHFWDVAGANDRMTLTTTGNVGVGTTAPTSKLTVNGSQAGVFLNIAAATTLGEQTHIWAAGATTYLVTLPAASTCTGRVYVITNTQIAKTISSYTTLANVASTTLALNTTLTLVSTGTVWKQF